MLDTSLEHKAFLNKFPPYFSCCYFLAVPVNHPVLRLDVQTKNSYLPGVGIPLTLPDGSSLFVILENVDSNGDELHQV